MVAVHMRRPVAFHLMVTMSVGGYATSRSGVRPVTYALPAESTAIATGMSSRGTAPAQILTQRSTPVRLYLAHRKSVLSPALTFQPAMRMLPHLSSANPA